MAELHKHGECGESRSANKFGTYVIEPSLVACFSQGDPDQGTRSECLESAIDILVRPEADIVDGMASVPLRLNDVPELAVRTSECADVRGLAAALGEDDGVMKDDFKERCGRRGRGLLLLSLAAVGRDGSRLRDLAGYGRRGQLAQEGGP